MQGQTCRGEGGRNWKTERERVEDEEGRRKKM